MIYFPSWTKSNTINKKINNGDDNDYNMYKEM